MPISNVRFDELWHMSTAVLPWPQSWYGTFSSLLGPFAVVPSPTSWAQGNFDYSFALCRISHRWSVRCLSSVSGFFHLAQLFEDSPILLQCQWFIPFHGWIVFHCTAVSHFAHSQVDRHLSCFQVLAVTNKAAVDTEDFAWISTFIPLQWNCWSRW